MIHVGETRRELPHYEPVPLTRLPLIYHAEHLFPYRSYGETRTTPRLRAWRFLTLENDLVRIEVAPELGGRVYSYYDKRLGRELLFSNPVVRPVRILPVWGFVSGGIEFNFPVAHSPTSIATVGCSRGTAGDYGWIRVGERELRTGMEWVVELGLHASSPVLVQRTTLRNATGIDHPWMMWTIAAVRSTAETEFVHPPHRVLIHDDRVTESAWPGDGLNWDRNLRQMTALFWKPGSAAQFGAFHHDLGHGLVHLADPVRMPGKKVWSYGHGRHRAWGLATTDGGMSYAEIESGPLLDQSERARFPSGGCEAYEEFWVPVHTRDACERVEWPAFDRPVAREPWLGWAHSPWQVEWECFRSGDGPLPRTVVPTGLELEPSLRAEWERGNERAREPLALWLAFRGQPEEALRCLGEASRPDWQRLVGLIRWKAMGDRDGGAKHLRRGPLEEPIAVVELDQLLAEMGADTEREGLLAGAPEHRLVRERRADLALVRGRPEEALALLGGVEWPREHQRQVRTELWRRAESALGREAVEVPEALGEDNLARFGAYWSDR